MTFPESILSTERAGLLPEFLAPMGRVGGYDQNLATAG
jgi:hypothetical protein